MARGVKDLPGQEGAEGVLAAPPVGVGDVVTPALPGVMEQGFRSQLVEPDPEDSEGAGHVKDCSEPDELAGLDGDIVKSCGLAGGGRVAASGRRARSG